MQKRHRIFIAINLPAEIRRFLVDYSKKWPELSGSSDDEEFSNASVMRWTHPENLHITLLFLGDITDVELGEVCMAVKSVTEKYQAFNLHLSRLGYGPEGKIPPRYIWAGGEVNHEAMALKKELENALLELVHFVPDKGIFSPHITLARIKAFAWSAINPEERPEVEQEIDLAFTVESIEVMESELKKGGPVYTVVESYPLS
jgi:2'-5' RNA ligase